MEKKKSGTLHDSLMVIVPHQDDEILMCAGILWEAAKRKIPAVVVMVTNGDYGSSDLSIGRSRLKETLAGLAMLGIDAGNVEFLGYADTGMPKEESFLNGLYEETDAGRLHRSHCSEETYGLEEKDEYHKKRWGAHAPYDRAHLAADLYGVIEEHRPAMIFTTSEVDTHGDHSALCLFVRDSLADFPVCTAESFIPWREMRTGPSEPRKWGRIRNRNSLKRHPGSGGRNGSAFRFRSA